MLMALAFSTFCSPSAEAALVFSTEKDGVESPVFYLNKGDSSDDFVDLNFGSSSGAQLRYNVVEDGFVLNRNLDLSLLELQNFKIELLASAPICDAGSIGRMYFNTTLNRTFVCDGAVFEYLDNENITGAQITDGTVDTADIADDAITSAKILDATLTAADLADDSVSDSEIDFTNVTLNDFTNDAGFITIDSDTLDALSCASGEVAKWNGSAWVCAPDAGGTSYSAGAGLTLTGTTFSNDLGTAIESSEITNSTILAEDIATNAIISSKIQDNAVTTSKINNSAVTSVKIANGTIVADDLAFGSVGSSAIVDGSVGSNELAAGSVTNAKMANGSVTGGTGGIIQDSSITADDLAFGSVDPAEIVDGSVGTNELANNAVTTVKINDGNVTANKLASNAVTSAKIAFGAVNANAIDTNAVGDSEINYTQVTLNDFTNDAGFITTDTNTTYTAGTGLTLTGTTFSNNLGTDIATGEIQDNAVTSAKILDSTIVTGDIANGTITFADLNNTDITLADFTNDLALTSANIFVGNASNLATAVTASGDLSLSNTGAFTIQDNSVDGTDIALGGDTTGDLMFYNGTDWARLALGTANQVLQVNPGATAPVWNNSTATKYQFIDIFGCIRGSATAGTVAGGNAPVIRFDGNNNSQMRCSLPVPSDWQVGTDINVDVYYSPSDNTAGNVQFELLHAAFGIGETVTSGSFADTVTGAASIAASTELDIYELSEDIPAASLALDDMINLNLARTPGVAADTYAGDINIHQLRISYTGKELQ